MFASNRDWRWSLWFDALSLFSIFTPTRDIIFIEGLPNGFHLSFTYLYYLSITITHHPWSYLLCFSLFCHLMAIRYYTMNYICIMYIFMNIISRLVRIEIRKNVAKTATRTAMDNGLPVHTVMYQFSYDLIWLASKRLSDEPDSWPIQHVYRCALSALTQHYWN